MINWSRLIGLNRGFALGCSVGDAADPLLTGKSVSAKSLSLVLVCMLSMRAILTHHRYK
jgi:hypothetical protein